MKTVEIKKCHTNYVIFSHECDGNSIKKTTEAAAKAGANLSGADLCRADLSGATYNDGVEIGNRPIFLTGLAWPVSIFKTSIAIGCQLHKTEDWLAFTDDEISAMSPGALKFWTVWKKHIIWMAVEHQDELKGA